MRILRMPWPLLLTLGCLPSRDNPFDTARAPELRIEVLVDGNPGLESHRDASLSLKVSATDPQRDRVHVRARARDPRGDPSGGCALFAPYLVGEGTIDTGSSDPSLSIPWSALPPACHEPLATGGAKPQAVRLEIDARDAGGARASIATLFLLRNRPPLPDPGPDLWVDPHFNTALPAHAVLDGSLTVDPDGDALTHRWRLTRGGPASVGGVVLGSALGSPVAVRLDGGPGAEYELEYTACDRWTDCAEPVTLGVRARRAVWMLANGGLLLLDPDFGATETFVDASSGDTRHLPACVAGACPELLPAADGVWVLARADDPATPLDERSVAVRVDPTGRIHSTPLPAGARLFEPEVFNASDHRVALGARPEADLAFVRAEVGSSHLVMRLGPGDTAVTMPGVPEALAVNPGLYVDQLSPDAPLWLASYNYDNYGEIVGAVSPVTGSTFFQLLDLSNACNEGEIVTGLVADPSGTDAYVSSDRGVMAVGIDGTIDPACVGGLTGGQGANVERMAWLPRLDGGVNLLLGFQGDVTHLVPAFGGVLDVTNARSGPDLNFFALSNDLSRGVTSILFGSMIHRYADSELTRVVAFGENLGVSVADGSGRFFGLSAPSGVIPRLTRQPRGITPVRAYIPGPIATQYGTHARWENASVDPLTGRLWIGEVDENGDGYRLAAFDERGRVPSPTGPLTLPAPPTYGLRGVVFDPGSCEVAPGSGCREAGVWVAYDLGKIARVSMDRTIQPVALPFNILDVRELALSPLDGRLCGVFSTGSAVVACMTAGGGVSSVSYPGVGPVSTPSGYASVGRDGLYWSVSNDGNVYRIPSDALAPASSLAGLCPMGDTPTSVRVDDTSATLVVSCGAGVSRSWQRPTKAGQAGASMLASQLPEGISDAADGVLDAVDSGSWLPSGHFVVRLDPGFVALPTRLPTGVIVQDAVRR